MSEKEGADIVTQPKLRVIVRPKIQVTTKPKISVKVKPKTKKLSETSSKPVVQATASATVARGRKPAAVSFDIGIKNLAYCILSYDDKLVIHDWGIINMASGDPKLTCGNIVKKSGKKCTHKAYYVGDRKSDARCKVHGKGKGLERNYTVENITELELKTKLFTVMDSRKEFLEPDIVLIESQPNKAREKIKGIGHSIFDYYVLRGMDHNRVHSVIKFIDAKNKLTVYDGPPISCHLKTQYARNKWYSTKYCDWILKNSGVDACQRELYQHSKKKDDLADCMLQGLWYLKYGQDGKKAPVTSNHQKLVYAEMNAIKYRTVRARGPSKKSQGSKRFTLSNIKYLLKKGESMDSLRTSIEYYFGSIEYFRDVLKKP